MDLARARAGLVLGALAAVALGTAAAAPSRAHEADQSVDAVAVAWRTVLPSGEQAIPPVRDRDDDAQATDDPTVVADPNGGHHEGPATAEPLEELHGGHDAHVEASPAASSAPYASPAPAAPNEHGTGAGHDGVGSSHEAEGDGHEEGGHDEVPVAQRPRGMVLGGFLALNSLVFAGAAWLRRRDRGAAALMARRPAGSNPSTTMDTSR